MWSLCHIQLTNRKKLNILDCGCHKGNFLKKIGLKRLKNGYLVDPLDYNVIKKLKLKNFKFLPYCLGSTSKKQSFTIYSSKYPEWSSINSLGPKSIYKKRYYKINLILRLYVSYKLFKE